MRGHHCDSRQKETHHRSKEFGEAAEAPGSWRAGVTRGGVGGGRHEMKQPGYNAMTTFSNHHPEIMAKPTASILFRRFNKHLSVHVAEDVP